MAAGGSGSNSNLLDLDILLRLPNPTQFATRLSTQLTSVLGRSMNDATRDALKQQAAASNRFQSALAQSSLRALKDGLGTKEIDEIRGKYDEISKARMQATVQMRKLEGDLYLARGAEEKKRISMEMEALKAFSNIKDLEAKKQLANLKRLEIEQNKSVRNSAMVTEKVFKGALADSFANIQSGDLEAFSTKMTTVFAKIMTAAAAKTSVMSDEAAAAGNARGAEKLAGVSDALAGMAKFAMVATAVVGALAAVMAIVSAVDSKFKDLNRTLLDGVGGFDYLGNGVTELGTALDNIREVTTDFGRALQLGATAEELNGMVNAMARFGSNLLDTSDAEQLGNTIDRIGTYARVTGESFEGMTTTFSEYADRMGNSLDEVVDGFGNVVSAARDSGFGVNRFQAAVFQATANTALYNKRLDETAALMNILSKSVGLEEATQLVQDTSDYYQNRSIGERFVDVSTTNSGTVTEIFENEIASMIRGMSGAQRTSMEASLRSGLEEQGVDTSRMGLQEMVAQLDTLSSDVRNTLIGGMERDDQRTTNHMLRLIRALEGGTIARAEGLQSLGTSGAFAMRYNQGRQLIGNRDFNKMSITDQMYMQQTVGMSPQEILRMQTVEQDFMAELANLNRAATGTAEDRRAYEAEGYSFDTETGAVYAGTDPETRMLIENITDYIQANSMRFEEEMTEDESITLARQVVENTQKFEDIIQNGVTSLLAQMVPLIQAISETIGNIFRWISRGDELTQVVSETDIEAARDALRNQISADIQAARDLERVGDATAVDTSGLVAEAENRIEMNRQSLAELDTIRTEGELREFLSSRNVGVQTTMMETEQRRERIFEESVFEDDDDWPSRRSPPKEIPEALTQTAEEAAEQTRIQEESLVIEEDQENTLNDLLRMATDSRAMDMLVGMGRNPVQAAQIMGGMYAGQTAEQLGIPQDLYDSLQATIAPRAHDFIFQSVGGGARITPIHSQDQFVGMKPGGPVDRAMGNGSGGGGVVINIHGGNTAEIMRTVNQVLERKGIYPSRPHRGK